MNKLTQILPPLILAAHAGAADAFYYSPNTGVLSYAFYNLSGGDCTLTAYGSGANSSAPNAPANTTGWGNSSTTANFFNPVGLGGDTKNPSSLVSNNLIFFNNYDPIEGGLVENCGSTTGNSSSTGANCSTTHGFPYTASSLASGSNGSIREYSSLLNSVSGNELINPAAMADSLSIACTPPSGTTTSQAMASMASSSNYMASGTGSSYPYNGSKLGIFVNFTFNPMAPSTCGTGGSTNPCGAGFVNASGAGSESYNFNPSTSVPNYVATGGLWSSVYNGVSSGGTLIAAQTLNAAMLPINFANYVGANGGGTPSEYPGMQQWYTALYGGHFSVAVGDPYVVSSYAAKMLWYLAANSPLSSSSTLSSLSNALSNGNSGVFRGSSSNVNTVGDDYVQWLMGSSSSSQKYTGVAQQAAASYYAAFQAASVAVDHESVWGKVFTAMADVAVESLVAATSALPGGDVVTAVAGGVAATAAGAVVPDMNGAIGAAFTSQVNAPAPQSQTAPVVINPTYASANLLGLLLTNVAVQQQISSLTGNNNCAGSTNPPNPLWTNFSIYTDNVSYDTSTGACSTSVSAGCSGIGLSGNLLSGSCYPSGGGTAVNNSASGSVPQNTYTNVYTSGTQTTQQMSIWNAILTGSDITTNADGYIVVGNSASGMADFSPPLQVLNATNGGAAPTAALSSGLSVSTTFNLNTGVLTASSYTTPYDSFNGDPTAAGSTPAPAYEPSISITVSGPNPTGDAYYIPFDQTSYSGTTGVLQVFGFGSGDDEYPFSNSPLTINLTGCPPDASVSVTITPDPSNTFNPLGSTGSISCQGAVENLTNNLTSVTLNYQSCVNDPNATGGVLVAVTTAPNSITGQGGAVTLACACQPSYLGGPTTTEASSSQTLGGVVVGATSTQANQTCPLPPT